MRHDPRTLGSGWVSALFLTLVLIGWAMPWREEPPITKDCTPIERREGVDPGAYTTLIGQGYRIEGSTIVPPGCESAR